MMRAHEALVTPGTGLSDSQPSVWARPKPRSPEAAAGIEVAELPRIDIDVPPVAEAPLDTPPAGKTPALAADPRLLPIVLALVSLIVLAAVAWALLV